MPKRPNQSDRLCAALTERGLREVTATTRRYRVFDRGDGQFYFVGKAGALRRGRTVTDSVSLERTRLRNDLLGPMGGQP